MHFFYVGSNQLILFCNFDAPTMMITDIETYFTSGCGRCKFFDTPQCKVHTWSQELALLRSLVNECMLMEQVKWGMPCYTLNGKNLIMIAAFKGYCSINFLNGALLEDADGILEKQGENSHAVRLIKFTDVKKVLRLQDLIKAYIFEAIEIAKAGLKIPVKAPIAYEMPDELIVAFKNNVVLKNAFNELTPGRQRSYLLHFAQAKQSKTKVARIEKCIPQIMKGKGHNEY
jgi:uncharacterized protein YdeI (YjbR/CyaY-like superfamily)